MRDFFEEWGWTLWVLFILVLIIVSIWFRVAAPCSWMDWVPAKEIPGRCVTWMRP